MQYNLSEHLDGAIDFDPDVDHLYFDNDGTLPTDVSPGDSSFDGIFTTRLDIISGPQAGHFIVLQGDVSVPELTTGNWSFASGARWLLGDNTTSRTGDDGANTLVGTAGADAFAGMGGSDSLVGAGGDDVFYLADDGTSGFDTIKGGAGVDTLICDDAATALAVNLGAGMLSGGMVLADGAEISGIENFLGGGFKDKITGSGAANRLVGNGGNDTVSGGGGDDQLVGNAGHDRLTGGADNDQFVFDAAPKSANSDVVTDFLPNADTLLFDNATGLFKALGADGALALAKFYSAAGATQAHDLSDRLIYDTDGGTLYYDPDGTGTKLPVLVATLTGGPDLSANNIFVI